VSNSGTINRLTNSGSISGGTASVAPTAITSLVWAPGGGGAGVSNSGTINKLTNSGMISGGAVSSTTPSRMVGKAVGGAGVSNSGMIATLANSGAINGGAASSVSGNATGGAGVSNSGTIAKLINSGMISGGAASAPHGKATPGDAIYSAGSGASIGTIANSGSIDGNVAIDNQSNVTITGGGSTFGSLTGGIITIGNGNLTFGGGATFLGDSVVVNGGTGTVTNMDPLKVATPQTITGNFTQAATGALDLEFAGETWGQYGALTITSLATLDGRLAIDLTNGFTLGKGDSFDILKFTSLTGNFDALALDGAACSMAGADSWSCGGGVRLNEAITATSLDLDVAGGSAALGPVGSAAPEPSTWALMLTGFAALAFAGYRRRRKDGTPTRDPPRPACGERAGVRGAGDWPLGSSSPCATS
jgi:mucin-19